MSDGTSDGIGTDVGSAVEKGLLAQHTFEFVPTELAAKCRKLIESYHAMHGYVGLADMLWLSDAREIIEGSAALRGVFKKATKSRGAKRANESLLAIATIIVSMEALARDFANWGKRFPAAKRDAEKVLGDFPRPQRTWLMDLYLYPPLGIRREFANALTPSATGVPLTARS